MSYQDDMSSLADAAAEMYGDSMEPVTYHARSIAGASPVDHPSVLVRLKDYRLSALNTDVILPTDQEMRIQTSLITWTVGPEDSVTREDGSEWKVAGPIRGGKRHPWYKFNMRKVG